MLGHVNMRSAGEAHSSFIRKKSSQDEYGMMASLSSEFACQNGTQSSLVVLECQNILESPMRGYGFPAATPPHRRERGTAVATGTASHSVRRLRSGLISCSFLPYYDLYFPGAWQLLVSEG